jgi:hypothetical protein
LLRGPILLDGTGRDRRRQEETARDGKRREETARVPATLLLYELLREKARAGNLRRPFSA